MEGPPPPRRRGYLVPGIIALAFLAGVATLLNLTSFRSRSASTLAGPEVATLIAQGIQADDRLGQPPQIRCPPSEPIESGRHFVCSLLRGRSAVGVEVTELDGRGRLSWHVLWPPPH